MHAFVEMIFVKIHRKKIIAEILANLLLFIAHAVCSRLHAAVRHLE